MSYDVDLLAGLAADLASIGVGAWRPDTPYLSSERGIVLHALPEEPDEVVAVAPYLEGEVATYRRDVESVVTFVQVRLRMRSAADAVDLQGRMRDRYHRRRVVLFAPHPGGPTEIAVLGRQLSRAPLGADANNRHLFTQNFSFSGLRARP